MNKKRAFMDFVLLDILVMGFFTGYWCFFLRNPWVSGIIGLSLASVAAFTGAVLAFMNSDERAMAKQKQLAREMEKSFEDKVKEALRKDREIYGAMSVEMAKAVADRVANRIVSKHVEGMSEDSVRESILKSVGAIIDEEIGILHKAMRNEASV